MSVSSVVYADGDVGLDTLFTDVRSVLEADGFEDEGKTFDGSSLRYGIDYEWSYSVLTHNGNVFRPQGGRERYRFFISITGYEFRRQYAIRAYEWLKASGKYRVCLQSEDDYGIEREFAPKGHIDSYKVITTEMPVIIGARSPHARDVRKYVCGQLGVAYREVLQVDGQPFVLFLIDTGKKATALNPIYKDIYDFVVEICCESEDCITRRALRDEFARSLYEKLQHAMPFDLSIHEIIAAEIRPFPTPKAVMDWQPGPTSAAR